MIVPAPNGARCLEVPADAPLWQEFRSAVSTGRLNRPSANRKRPRSISRGFQSIRGAIRGAVGAAELSTRHRHACGPVGRQPARAPVVREPPWLDHVLDAADLSAPRRMRVAVYPRTRDRSSPQGTRPSPSLLRTRARAYAVPHDRGIDMREGGDRRRPLALNADGGRIRKWHPINEITRKRRHPRRHPACTDRQDANAEPGQFRADAPPCR